jgi:hypothetical protein
VHERSAENRKLISTVFTVFFTLEFLVRTIADGLVLGDKAYLKVKHKSPA